ncbi:Gfo/Idh/MocA family protein [Polycladidibacter hongkongensis]|uniref:Gfo/Idh/MocA family protein n=1 Tax=Polycladidibacter hongkongensis TaxID=1647556 RepID=UPI000832FAE6|nr:Gfo/Idh/MocA family oxidoreductase [Pseudovibrio hongkongensis]
MTQLSQPFAAQPLPLGMVGGGQGAFIGAVHRIAARMDGHFQLVSGALSSDAQRAAASAAQLGIAPERCYTSYAQMAKAEAARPDGIRAVAITTPNHMHFPVAKAFLQAGIHVICDKPLTAQLAEAEELAAIGARSNALFILTHNYTGYPMIRAARQLVAEGQLGDIRLVKADYLQDWLATPLEQEGQKQASWRTDPAQTGAGGAIGDIGSHAYNLISFVSGLQLQAVAADLSSFVEGRRVDDNANLLLRFKPVGSAAPARGQLCASQIATGKENQLTLKVYGSKAGLEWDHECPDQLRFTPLGESTRILTRAGVGANAAANRAVRVPGGHPEGYLEAFANIYAEAALAIRQQAGEVLEASAHQHYPSLHDGLEGMRFIAAAVRSSNQDARWVTLAELQAMQPA